jgi:CYTH domain-containing protein
MSLEIEKKYLLKSLPDILLDYSYIIEQYYNDKGERFRKTTTVEGEESFVKTIKKFIKPGVKQEIENEISYANFTDEIKNCIKFISKRRYIITSNNLKWEIDEIEHSAKGSLIICEVELDSEEKLLTVEPPIFIQDKIIKDVTILKEYNNINLAMPCNTKEQ